MQVRPTYAVGPGTIVGANVGVAGFPGVEGVTGADAVFQADPVSRTVEGRVVARTRIEPVIRHRNALITLNLAQLNARRDN